jgi:hypothetical protein
VFGVSIFHPLILRLFLSGRFRLTLVVRNDGGVVFWGMFFRNHLLDIFLVTGRAQERNTITTTKAAPMVTRDRRVFIWFSSSKKE